MKRKIFSYLRKFRCTLSEYVQAKLFNTIKYLLTIYSDSKNSNLIVNNEYTSKNIIILCLAKRENDKYI